ncbi:hypothetical protein [Nostoc sp. CHAB 5715]|uniref:hypothetical protein n=1 Tax=Nostoc sp. CHAB 5715 TaxID=2780400 RepID=UPI001E4AE290|nr:hypothetical protein [Nostoc sp. CHAB 5715]MCC5620890.1 hypothetical protein [Nostoc sp. CHAB 5715]
MTNDKGQTQCKNHQAEQTESFGIQPLKGDRRVLDCWGHLPLISKTKHPTPSPDCLWYGAY